MTFQIAFVALGCFAPLMFIVGLFMVIFQLPVRLIEKDDHVSGFMALIGLMLWGGAAFGANIVHTSMKWPAYAFMADLFMGLTLFGIIIQITGVLIDHRRNRKPPRQAQPQGQQQSRIPAGLLSAMLLPQVSQWFFNRSQQNVVAPTQHQPPPPQQPPPNPP